MRTSFIPQLQRSPIYGTGATTTDSTGTFWGSLGGSLTGISSIIASIKGQPTSVTNILPAPQQDNGMNAFRAFLPIILIIAVILVLVLVLKPKK